MTVEPATRHQDEAPAARIDLALLESSHRNLNAARLYEHAVRRGEGIIAREGPLVVRTKEHTGRSPDDKFIVHEPRSEDDIWWGPVNQPLDEDHFDRLYRRVVNYLAARKTYSQDLYAGADPDYRLPVRVISESAWSSLFARNLFIVPTDDEPATTAEQERGFTVLHAPLLEADPARDGTESETAIAIHLARRVVLILGTRYAGEIKKSIFSVLNYVLPQQGIASMHCSANAGPGGDAAIFFGLSGTGKTTLSADPTRTLIGDDEHGWTDRGIFNFEGGCYAKTINLSADAEPMIFRATHRFGTVLENVVVDPDTRALRLDDDSLTENTRAAFPISYIENASPTGMGDHPRNVVMLTADAFGVLPPVARLSPAQAMYYFLSGYTSKLAGTERGVDEPESTFSACFGAPFLPLHPSRYAQLLGERIRKHRPDVWLVNTGWTGGAYGVGQRISIAHTRAIIGAIVGGELVDAPTMVEDAFGLTIPTRCPGVPDRVLQPRSTWTDPAAYDTVARRLAADFEANFTEYADLVPDRVQRAGP